MGVIYNIQHLSLHDGPGIRTTVFLKGCPLRCAWCHNPESQRLQPQLSHFQQRCLACGQCMAACRVHQLLDGVHHIDYPACTACGRCADACAPAALEILGHETAAEEIAAQVLRDKPFYDTSGGGMTLSGGEPTMQADFAAQVLSLVHRQGVHTAMETCGHAAWSAFDQLLPHLDLILFDLKQMDSSLHRRFTGVGNKLILQNLTQLCAREQTVQVVVRMPVIPGYTDQPGHFSAAADFLVRLPRVPRVEVLPYNPLAGSKYPRLGMTYSPGTLDESAGTPPDGLCALLTQRGLTAAVLR